MRASHRPADMRQGDRHRAAPFLADLVACGLPGRAEALAALLHAARPAERPRIISTPDAAVPHSRAAAARAARAVLAPLLESRSSRQVLLAAATGAARQALRASEIEALTADAIARHLRAARRPSARKTAP